MANLLIQIVVFAQSSVTLVYLAAYIGMYMINELVYCKKHALFKAVVLFGGGVGSLLLIESLQDRGPVSRCWYILCLTIRNVS